MEDALIAYEHGDYPQALKLLYSMVIQRPWNEKLWHAIGATKKMLCNYSEAIEAWELCALLNPQDPLPFFYQAECYLAQSQIENSLNALNSALEKPCTEKLIKKIQVIKEIINHEYHPTNCTTKLQNF